MKIVFLFLLLAFSAPVLAQNVDYNKVILPDGSQAPDFEEKLVQLAWKNHPNNEAVRREVNIAAYNVKQSNVSWLEHIHITGNINQFNIDKSADALSNYRSSFYPLYNFGASITLGAFFTIPYNIRKSKETLMIAMDNVNAQKLTVRNTVLKLYNDFLMFERIYKLQSQALLDNETSHKLAEQRFRRGEITFETYSLSLTSYNSVMVSQLQAERDFKNAKLDLEQWIGVRLEDVR